MTARAGRAPTLAAAGVSVALLVSAWSCGGAASTATPGTPVAPTTTPTASVPSPRPSNSPTAAGPDEAGLRLAWLLFWRGVTVGGDIATPDLYRLLSARARQTCSEVDFTTAVEFLHRLANLEPGDPLYPGDVKHATPEYLDVAVAGTNGTVRGTFRLPDGTYTVEPAKVTPEAWTWEEGGWRYDPGAATGSGPCQFGGS